MIRPLYFWPRLREDIRTYIKHCHECQTLKSKPKSQTTLYPHEIPTESWSTVGIDWIVDLPESCGYNGIMTVTDFTSKRVPLVPSRSTDTALDTARKFRDYVYTLYGLPSKIVSDRDPRFTSKFWTELTKLLGISRNVSTAYHPQTDGQAEATNKKVVETLRFITQADYQENWVQHLAMIEFAINNTPLSETGTTPFFNDTGRHPRTVVGKLPSQTNPSATSFANFMTEHVDHIWEILLKGKQKQTDRNSPRKLQLYKVGDQVLLDARGLHLQNTPTAKNKLDLLYYGPFSIAQIVSPTSYDLELPRNWRIHPVFHTSKLRP